jgi:hypothetical protein
MLHNLSSVTSMDGWLKSMLECHSTETVFKLILLVLNLIFDQSEFFKLVIAAGIEYLNVILSLIFFSSLLRMSNILNVTASS